jgi:hypothetical protein
MSLQSQQLGIFGWNWFSPAQVQATTTSNGNIKITNAAGLLALLPQQKTGTALYETNIPSSPKGELAEQPYDHIGCQKKCSETFSSLQFKYLS